ncbi:hypothetical protein CABS01_06861 [Colletotrichum abscissum]|uniref:uncharacterized protein n=1 Tax=Colletotrichum abscissum TaxID=1671311 RepID=UPI0027D5FFCC|nr:uncharacterized protein CABS01_06861 [Colletotrichum abscissum]KAK1514882.1 hypothetical protein CABS01_06861 [Colletotrichum abscissum]
MFGRSIPALGEWAKGLMDGNGPAFLAGTKAPNLSEASANQSPPDDASQHDVEPYSGLAGAQGGTSERGLFESSSWAASSAVRFGGYFSPLDLLCEAYNRLLSRMAWRVWLCSALLPLAEQSVGKVRCGDGILCPILPLGRPQTESRRRAGGQTARYPGAATIGRHDNSSSRNLEDSSSTCPCKARSQPKWRNQAGQTSTWQERLGNFRDGMTAGGGFQY